MLTNPEIARIQSYSIEEARQSEDVYTAALTPPGLAQPTSLGSLFEIRVLDILTQELPAQLAVSYLIPPAQQAMANRLETAMGTGANTISTWTALTPLPVQQFCIGDLQDTLEKQDFPAVTITSSLPGGTDRDYPNIGSATDNNCHIYIYYVQPYQSLLQTQVESYRAAEAIADIMTRHQGDGVVKWQNGKVHFVQRNTPVVGGEKTAQLSVGVVLFSCFRRLTYTPAVTF